MATEKKPENQSSPKIVVVGSTYIDLAIRCDRFPTLTQAVTGSGVTYSPAGSGLNQAIEAALCGCDVQLISRIGQEPLAAMALEILIENNVSLDYVNTTQGKNTGLILTMVNTEGENASCYCTGANAALLKRDIEQAEEQFHKSNLCLVNGDVPYEAAVAAIKTAQVHGVRTILLPAGTSKYIPVHTELPDEFFLADIFISNLGQAADMTDHSAAGIRQAKMIGSDIVARGVKAAIITMGMRGCLLVERDSAEYIPAIETDFVDRSGSGDAFAGALAAFCTIKDDMKAALNFSSAAAALACSKFGSVESMPTKAEIIELLQKQDK